MRVFLDTNIIVSAFATRGLCADLFREILAAHTLITSEHILQETEDVLARRFKVPEETVGEIIALLRKQEIVTPSDTPPQISIRDLDDLPVVAAAIEAKADLSEVLCFGSVFVWLFPSLNWRKGKIWSQTGWQTGRLRLSSFWGLSSTFW